MSAAGGGSREVAYRLFAAEFGDADRSYSESDEERAPNYVITPTGARVNRLFVVGVLTEVEAVNEEMVRARVVDPTGAFVVYAGQYQPDALAFFERADPPTFVAVTGKARTFQPEDGDRIYTSVRPEAVSAVDAGTRDRWTVQAAERTLERVGIMAGALAADRRGDDLTAALREQGVAEGLAVGIPIAIDHYGTTPSYLEALRELALDALEVVAGERDEVSPHAVAPDAPGDVAPGDLAEVDVAGGPPTVAGAADGSAASGDGRPADEDQTGGPADGAEAPAESDLADSTVTEPEVADEPDEASAQAEAETGPQGSAEATAEAAETETETPEELGDFEDGEYDLDEAERREVEATYGTEFETGTEIDEPGEAGIESETEAGAEVEVESATESESETADAPSDETADATSATTEGEAEPAGDDVDLEEAAVAAMRELDDGDGADREAVVAAVVEAHDVEPDAVDAAIQDALMSGQCYEPAEGRLTAI